MKRNPDSPSEPRQQSSPQEQRSTSPELRKKAKQDQDRRTTTITTTTTHSPSPTSTATSSPSLPLSSYASPQHMGYYSPDSALPPSSLTNYLPSPTAATTSPSSYSSFPPSFPYSTNPSYSTTSTTTTSIPRVSYPLPYGGQSSETSTFPSAAARASSSAYSAGLFVLSEQPSARQRKSYPNEHRFLLPNPLQVIRREAWPGEVLPHIVDGSVSVKLVNREGEDLPEAKRNILIESSDDKTMNESRTSTQWVKPLDTTSLSAIFSLLVMETSEGNMFRLEFVVKYTIRQLDNTTQDKQERILSRPFIVYSSRRKNLKAPVVFEIRPKEGSPNTETECWIKGKGFSERVDVMFGSYPGRVIECAENLITVISPIRHDITTSTTVTVEVSNMYLNELIPASKKLFFTYTVE